jgi:phosphohistidine phosphatase SixA
MKMNQLLLLPHLPTKQTKRKEPLVDYLKSHVMTNAEYLVVMHKKVMEKVVAKAIRETHQKEREENKIRKSTSYHLQMNGHLNMQLLEVQQLVCNNC